MIEERNSLLYYASERDTDGELEMLDSFNEELTDSYTVSKQKSFNLLFTAIFWGVTIIFYTIIFLFAYLSWSTLPSIDSTIEVPLDQFSETRAMY